MVHFQTTPSNLWTFYHFFGSNFFISFYDSNSQKIYPSEIISVPENYLTNVYFGEATAGYAVITQKNDINVFPSIGEVSSLAINHNLNSSIFNIQVYNATNELIIPDEIEIVDENNIVVYLDEPEQIFVLINSSTYVEEPTLDTDI
jgi:hypothetical protein